MQKKETGNIPQIAQKLINHLPKEMDDELKKLITRAEAGQNVTTELVDLFSRYETTRLWFKEQLNSQSREMGTVSSYYDPLAGNSSLISLSQKWICPKNKCDRWMLVIQEGEDPPICERHNVEMLRGNERKG